MIRNPIKIGLGKLKSQRQGQVRLGQSDPHRLFGDRRRVDRHPARHRRAVRAGADPGAAARRQDRRGISAPLHQRRVAGRRRTPAPPMTACSRATRPASRWSSTSRATASCRPTGADVAPRLSGAVTLPDGRRAVPAFQLVASAISSRSMPPDAVAAADRHRRRDDPAHRRRAGPCRLRADDRDRPALDRLGRAPAREDDRPAGRACMPCAASRPIPTASTPAAPSMCCRCCWAAIDTPGQLPLQAAVSAAHARRRSSRPADRSDVHPGKPMPGPPLGFPPAPRGSAGRGRRRRRRASTGPSPGRRRWPCTACCTR